MIKNIEGVWFCDIQPGGRGHKRYQRKFRTKAEARRFELFIAQKVDQDNGFVIPAKDNRKLHEFISLWYLNAGKHLSSGNDTYVRLLHASSAMGSPIIRTFKPVVFLQYRSDRIDKGITSATLNRELQTLKTVFNDLISSGQFEGKNPFSTIKKIRAHQPKTTFLSTEQIEKLFSYIKKSDSDAYLISLICLATGGRWGEAQNLSYSDLNNTSLTYHNTKSKKSRTVPLSSGLYTQLKERLKQGSFNDSYSTFTRRLYESGIELPKGQRTHILRHTFASHFMINGGNIMTLQSVLGHSTLNMTMKYAHLAPNAMNEVIEKNPALMFL